MVGEPLIRQFHSTNRIFSWLERAAKISLRWDSLFTRNSKCIDWYWPLALVLAGFSVCGIALLFWRSAEVRKTAATADLISVSDMPTMRYAQRQG